MFKLLMTFVILGLLGVLAYVIYRLVKDVMDGTAKPSTNDAQDIDAIIDQLHYSIWIAEREAQSGVATANEKLAKHKADLKKAIEYKKKFNK
jgi:hypothetical protein